MVSERNPTDHRYYTDHKKWRKGMNRFNDNESYIITGDSTMYGYISYSDIKDKEVNLNMLCTSLRAQDQLNKSREYMERYKEKLDRMANMVVTPVKDFDLTGVEYIQIPTKGVTLFDKSGNKMDDVSVTTEIQSGNTRKNLVQQEIPENFC